MRPPKPAHAFAPAKINLALHVTGQRADGYHLLDSLVVLTDPGDRLTVRPSDRTRLTVSGPMASGVPDGADNLALRAAALMGVTAEILLEKHLPAAAGIGGGSSDAAACLRALAEAFDVPMPQTGEQLTLGADVPVCMTAGLQRMQGIGDRLTALGPAPAWPMILVNPGVQVPTRAVFSGLDRKDNPPMPADFPPSDDPDHQLDWLSRQRNDLEAPARAVAPVIGDVLTALGAIHGCRLARMSGSGATCFAILSDTPTRDAAVASLRESYPNWWVMPATPCGPDQV